MSPKKTWTLAMLWESRPSSDRPSPVIQAIKAQSFTIGHDVKNTNFKSGIRTGWGSWHHETFRMTARFFLDGLSMVPKQRHDDAFPRVLLTSQAPTLLLGQVANLVSLGTSWRAWSSGDPTSRGLALKE